MHPILFQIGHFSIRSYGVMISLAIVVGAIVILLEAKRKGIDQEKILEFLVWGVLAGLIGARLAYVLFVSPDYYLANPLEVFAVWRGGLANQGMIAGVILAALWFAGKNGISFWRLADTFAPGAILAQVVGRIGCFLDGHALGLPAKLPWSIYMAGAWRHPSHFYEMGLNLMAFGLLWALRGRLKYEGALFLIYLILYSTNRFIVQFFREDQVAIFGLPAIQTIAVATIIAAGALILYLKERKASVRSGHGFQS